MPSTHKLDALERRAEPGAIKARDDALKECT